jgi:hypothetical protein
MQEVRILPSSQFILLASDFLHAVKSYGMGPPALLALGSSGKHSNHYTTEATKFLPEYIPSYGASMSLG